MSTEENKAMIQKMMSGELNMMDSLAEDCVYTISGVSKNVGGTLRGKQEIIEKLMTPIMGLLEPRGKSVLTNMVAEDDQVVAEFYGVDRMTKAGKPYNNKYCMVYRFKDGKITQMTEYCDTFLAKEVLPELVLPR